MELYIDIAGKIIAVAFVTVLYFAYGKLKAYIETQKAYVKNEDARKLIESFVEAAEQLLKMDDPTGQKRKEYVISMLKEIGAEIDAGLDAEIEAAVYRLNHDIQ